MKKVTDLARMKRKKEDQGSGVQGVLIIDKPEGLTSHDVVQKVRKTYAIRQVGHAGTLDPIASGVLVMLVGSATRIAQYLQEDDKEYHLVLKLGLETDTQDITGKVLNEADPSGITPGIPGCGRVPVHGYIFPGSTIFFRCQDGWSASVQTCPAGCPYPGPAAYGYRIQH